MSAGYWSGPTSPLNEQEMAGMAAAEVLKLRRHLEARGKDDNPTPEGLARLAAKSVKASPQDFGAVAERIVDLDPTYVRAVLGGLEAAAKEGDALPWPQTLTLIEVAVSSPELEETPEIRERHDLDPDWRWARKEAASLIETVLQGDLLPPELSERASGCFLRTLSWEGQRAGRGL